MSSAMARGSITAPERICAPTSEPFSRTQTEMSVAICFARIAAASPAGPAPTMTMSYCIDSRAMRRIIIGAPMESLRSPLRRLVHTERIPIRWGDMDAMGHVNNTVYFRYMEQARVEWLESLRERVPHMDGLGSVIVNASCTFLLPLSHPGNVDVRMYVDQPGRSSIDSHY